MAASPAFCRRKRAGPWVRTSSSAPMFGKSARYCAASALILIILAQGRTYPSHYHSAVRNTDILIHPRVPLAGYVPGPVAIERMISAGEDATRLALHRFTAHAA